MSQEIINTGTNANDGSGDSLRLAMQKINANFTELYAPLEIIDPIPSANASSATPVLIKEYTIGSLVNKKVLEFTFLFHKNSNAGVLTNCIIHLIDTTSSTTYILATNAMGSSIQHTGIERICALQNNSINVINTAQNIISSISTGEPNVNINITNIAINSQNIFKIRVFVNNSNSTSQNIRQYFGKINLK